MSPNEDFKNAYAKAVAKHKGDHLIPKDERFLMGERLRAAYVIEANGGSPDAAILSSYSIAGRVIEEFCGSMPTVERKIRMADKRRAVESWVKDNIGVTVTPQTIAEIGDFSYSTALSYINEHVNTFIKVKRGFYLVRDQDAERAAQRKAS
jgi:hypothetical protein